MPASYAIPSRVCPKDWRRSTGKSGRESNSKTLGVQTLHDKRSNGFHALTQITVDQLRHAMATEEGDIDFNRENMPATGVLTVACQGLVKIDGESKIIRLAHFTIYEFFRDVFSKEVFDTHRTVAKTCLTYLMFKVFDRGPCKYISSRNIDMLGASGDIKPTDVLPRRIFQYPFIKYAANHWGDHARLSPESSIQSSISAFLEQPQRLASTIQTRYAEFEFAYDADLEARYAGSLALHAAVCYGLEATVDLLLTTLTVGQINGIDCRGKTALHWAIESKSTSIALKLLQARADLESDVRGEMSMRVICTISTGPDWSVIRGRIGDDLDQQSPELVAKGDLVYISVESEQIEIFRTYLSSANNDTEKKARAKNV